MKKKKILFVHFDLGHGGAEKALVTLLNNLPQEKYDISLLLLFRHGVNMKYLPDYVRLKCIFNCKPFRGITKLLCLLSPRLLHSFFIREEYDVEIAYIEGSPTRIVSGNNNKSTKCFAWVHTSFTSFKEYVHSYRSAKEISASYNKFNKVFCVSEAVRERFIELSNISPSRVGVVYNLIPTCEIKTRGMEPIQCDISEVKYNLCSVGRLNWIKGYDRLIKALSYLYNNGYNNWHLYILGKGEDESKLRTMVIKERLEKQIFFLGYDDNPHKYVSKMDLFVCSSYTEGLSTAVTESIVLSTPVLTTNCSGMNEIFGKYKCGLIVDNSVDGLIHGIKSIFDGTVSLEQLKSEAMLRSKDFSIDKSLNEFDKLFLDN